MSPGRSARDQGDGFPKRVALLLGFSGYQPLIRAYIGQGLRQELLESLRRHGVDDAVISSALAELRTA